MARIELLDLNDDILYALCEAASIVHPPHWEFPALAGEHGQQPSDDQSMDLSGKTFCMGWVFLSHVCRRLRHICLASPNLWAKVMLSFPSSNKEHWGEILSRAGPADLTLKFPSHYQKIRDTQAYLELYTAKICWAKVNMHRAKILETIVDDQPPLDWRNFFNQAHPKLTHLSLHQHPPSQITINAPNLLELTVANTIPVLPSPLQFLRVLSLDLQFQSTASDGAGFTAYRLVLDVLRGTPLLEDLVLTLNPTTNTVFLQAPNTDPPIVLDHLRKAYFLGSGDDIIFVWPAIRAPERVALDIAVAGPCRDKAIMFRSAVRQMRRSEYQLFTISLSRVFTVVAAPRMGRELGPEHHTASVGFRSGDGEDLSDAIKYAQEALNPEQFEMLHVIAQKPATLVSSPVLFTFLGAFRAVTVLSLNTDMDSTNHIYHLLIANAASLMPALQTFGACHGSMSVGVPADYWQTVIRFLEARAHAERHISYLLLFGKWPWKALVGKEAWDELDRRSVQVARTFVKEMVDHRIN